MDEIGRHSGNGFSYAYTEGFLKSYFAFGIHENQLTEKTIKTIDKIKSVQYNTFDDIKIKKNIGFRNAINTAIEHVSNNFYGIEIDCSSIENIPLKSKKLSGFSVNNVRTFIQLCSTHKNASYLHICGANFKKNSQNCIGDMISNFILDFMKAKANTVS